MSRLFVVVLSVLLAAGCATRPCRDGIISEELPLTLDDLSEIREGEKNHELILQEYTLFESPNLETYVNTVAANIAAVSTRPHLPYKVILLDDDDVNIFGGPGGHIYMTRGMVNFVESEAELAGMLAHEIGHISAYEYANIPQLSRLKQLHTALLKGSEIARDSIGTYGTAFHYGMKGIDRAAPIIAQRYGNDQEVEADKKAIEYLLAAGYDPRGLESFADRLAKVQMQDVGRFVILLNTHPPFQVRRDRLTEKVSDLDLNEGEIEFQKDTLNEVRQLAVNSSDSIIFEPKTGVHRVSESEVMPIDREKFNSISPRKRDGWL